MNDLPLVTIYTDGACDPNPGPGGWAALLRSAGQTKELTGGEPDTTNNRMELTAAARALQIAQPSLPGGFLYRFGIPAPRDHGMAAGLAKAQLAS